MGEHPPFSIVPVRTSDDARIAQVLFSAYAASLDVDLAYQNFDDELAALPGKYAPPAGELLLARGLDGMPLGCVALRSMDAPGSCEMKRLYVGPQARGVGLGRALIEAICAAAAKLGYREIRLDTLPSMTEAIALYRKIGFEPIVPYYQTPVAGTLFLRRQLS